MQRARHYLLNTNLHVNNIANLLGLDSAEHFARMFKKHRGMTPTQYREQFMRASIKKQH
jgi:two-component system response regulator YesN